MNSIDFLKNINDIDSDLLAAAAAKPAARRKNTAWVRWASLAACVCVIGFLGYFSALLYIERSTPHKPLVSFALNDVQYSAPSLLDYEEYNLIDEVADGRSATHAKSISHNDLGEQMGTIEIVVDKRKIQYKVYHFAAYPEDDSICIIAYPNGEYQIFVRKEEK